MLDIYNYICIYIYTVGRDDQQTDILWEADIVSYGVCR